MPQQRELVAEFIRERNVFQNGDESRVIIGEVCELKDVTGIDHNGGQCFSDFLDGNSTLVIKGEADEKQLRPGLTYRFYGHDFTYAKYGKQFVFSAFTVEQPATEDAVVEYLQQCKGIGPGIARRLWDNFGSNAIASLRTNPAKCADEVKGLKSDVAAEAAAFLKQFEGIERTKTEVLGLLAHRGFPKKTTEHAIKKWGSDAGKIIRRNPHYLMTFRGCGFLKTDKMYLELGLKPDRLKRQALCAWHAIARDSEGHTWFPLSLAQGAIARSVSGGQLRPDDATELAIRAQMLELRNSSGCDWISEKRKADAEGRVADAIFRASKEQPQWPDVDVLAQQGLGEEQFVELQKGLAGTVGLLTGAPGTGKTFTAAAVIREIMRMTGGDGVAAAAPTGKAAVRLTELLVANGISLAATTIHRLLQVKSQEGGGWQFRYNTANPLPHQYVFIDESSMLDTDLMASLLSARGPGGHFLFLGDENQLAPVGHGSPLKDMIAAGVPCGTLKEIRRNSGRIVRACAAIRDEKKFVPSPAGIDLENGENLLHVETSRPEETIERLQQFIESIRAGGKYDPVWDVQILVAVNKKSKLGRRPLNLMLQQLLNPDGERAGKNVFRRGDKILNLKNGKFKSYEPDHPEADGDGNVNVANGEIGEVIAVEPTRTICRLLFPDRVVMVFHGAGMKGNSSENGADGSTDENDKRGPNRTDEDDDEDTGMGCTWDLAYAISTHKSQGSEFPIGVILIDDYAGAQRLCTRNWLFTGISRAKKLCITIGPQRLAQQMCQKDGLRRMTFLVERVRELQNPPPKPVAVSDDVFKSLFAATTALPAGALPAEMFA